MSRLTTTYAALVISIAFGLTPAAAQIPQIDGEFGDWSNVHQLATDPVGDSEAGFDITSLSANSNGSLLYLKLIIDTPLNLQNGDSKDGDLILSLEVDGKQLSVDFRNRKVSVGNEDHIGWAAAGFQCLPTFASKRFELQIDLSTIGAKPGDPVSIQFSGSDQLAAPAVITLQPARHKLPIAFDWAKPKGTLRIVSQNTLQNGLADSERGPKFKRLFNAVQGDVYCFQEEWKKEDFMSGVGQVLDCNGNALNVHYFGGCAIATCQEMYSLPMEIDRGAAALIISSDSRPVVVLSVHAKCCGFAGSTEDDKRIAQFQQIVGEIKRMRDGVFGNKAKDAPVIVVGDYNLVGSRKPVNVLNSAGLSDVVCRAPDGSAYTWRGLKTDESFWPGRLDIVSANGFGAINGRILDTGRISDAARQEAGLEADDSSASDHLTIVVDCLW